MLIHVFEAFPGREARKAGGKLFLGAARLVPRPFASSAADLHCVLQAEGYLPRGPLIIAIMVISYPVYMYGYRMWMAIFCWRILHSR